MSKGNHLIYLWDNVSGSLVQTLEGPKEEVSLALASHEASVDFCWCLDWANICMGTGFPAKVAGSLFLNIEAIETNIEYIEKEDEFDLPVEEEVTKKKN